MYKIDKQFHSLREGELQNLSPEIFFFFNLLFLIDASLFDFDFSIHSSSCLFKNIYHRSKQAFLFITRRPPCGTREWVNLIKYQENGSI